MTVVEVFDLEATFYKLLAKKFSMMTSTPVTNCILLYLNAKYLHVIVQIASRHSPIRNVACAGNIERPSLKSSHLLCLTDFCLIFFVVVLRHNKTNSDRRHRSSFKFFLSSVRKKKCCPRPSALRQHFRNLWQKIFSGDLDASHCSYNVGLMLHNTNVLQSLRLIQRVRDREMQRYRCGGALFLRGRGSTCHVHAVRPGHQDGARRVQSDVAAVVALRWDCDGMRPGRVSGSRTGTRPPAAAAAAATGLSHSPASVGRRRADGRRRRLNRGQLNGNLVQSQSFLRSVA